MFDTVFGLPMHPLVVHATVILIPLAAALLIAAAVHPRIRRWAGWLTAVPAVAVAILVPITSQSGEALEHRVGKSALIEAHSELADQLLPFVIVMAVLAVALVWLTRAERKDGVAPAGRNRSILMGVVVLSVLAGLASVVQVARVGHSGATAVWSEDMQSSTPPAGEGNDD